VSFIVVNCVVRLLIVLLLVDNCVVLLLFVSFYVLFVCKCVLYCTVLYCTVLYCTVLYYCHRVTTKLHITNISLYKIVICLLNH